MHVCAGWVVGCGGGVVVWLRGRSKKGWGEMGYSWESLGAPGGDGEAYQLHLKDMM